MKQLTQLSVLIFFSAVTTLQAQSYYETVINSSLLAHISANHITREASLANFNSIFKKQKEFYEESNKKIVQVVAIHVKIYQNLYNVNSLFGQSKQIKYIKDYVFSIIGNLRKINKLAVENPQYSFWLKKETDQVYSKVLSIIEERKAFLTEDRKRLMDSADRDALLDRIYMKLRLLNVSILDVINIIEFNKSRAYIYSIPVFNNFVEHDKQLVEEIMQKYRRYKHY